MEENFLLDIWRKLVGEGFNLYFQEEVIVIVLQEGFDVVLELGFKA